MGIYTENIHYAHPFQKFNDAEHDTQNTDIHFGIQKRLLQSSRFTRHLAIGGLMIRDSITSAATSTYKLLLLVAFSLLLGCGSINTFNESARAGDTVAVAAGWQHYFTPNNVTVTITPQSGAATVYQPNNPAIRAIVNLYPDPVSSLIVSPQVGANLTQASLTYASTISVYTKKDPDMWQTTAFIDLPNNLPVGPASIQITDPQGETASVTANIVDGTGTPSTFSTTAGTDLSPPMLAALGRVSNNTVNFSGSTIPYAIQIAISHNPDLSHGGAGYVYVVNPRGDLKTVEWNDTGTQLSVILLPAKQQTLGAMNNFKFYIAGGINNLVVTNIQAFDSSGNPVPGVTASISN